MKDEEVGASIYICTWVKTIELIALFSYHLPWKKSCLCNVNMLILQGSSDVLLLCFLKTSFYTSYSTLSAYFETLMSVFVLL